MIEALRESIRQVLSEQKDGDAGGRHGLSDEG